MKDIVYVKHQQRLGLSNGSLRFHNPVTGEEHFMLAEEVGAVIFDAQKSYIEVAALTKLQANHVLLFFCDEKHSPTGLLCSEYSYLKKLAVLKKQLSLPKKTKGRLWRKIIMSKIQNQRNLLVFHLGISIHADREFEALIKEVQEFDSTLREAVAAKKYFKLWDQTGFKRGRFSDRVNSSLNYGYAILRSAIRHSFAAHGFEPSFGIGHESEENPFNLADDLIEPYRPFVDQIILTQILSKSKEIFDQEDRLLLIEKVLLSECLLDGKTYHISDAVARTVESYLRCLEKGTIGELLLPELIEPLVLSEGEV